MAVSQLKLNLDAGSVGFNFTPEAARELQGALSELLERLKAVSATATTGSGGKANPQEPLEYQQTGDVFLEVFCNPNIWPTPFAAKVLLTVRDDRIRLSTEAELTRILEDVNLYLEQHG